MWYHKETGGALQENSFELVIGNLLPGSSHHERFNLPDWLFLSHFENNIYFNVRGKNVLGVFISLDEL